MRRSLVYPILTKATLCSFELILTACDLPCIFQVEGSEVGIILCRLNAKSDPPWTTSTHPKSTTSAMDEIACPGSRMSSRMAVPSVQPRGEKVQR